MSHTASAPSVPSPFFRPRGTASDRKSANWPDFPEHGLLQTGDWTGTWRPAVFHPSHSAPRQNEPSRCRMENAPDRTDEDEESEEVEDDVDSTIEDDYNN